MTIADVKSMKQIYCTSGNDERCTNEKNMSLMKVG